MKAIGIFTSIVLALGLGSLASAQSKKAPETLRGGWKLAWNEEFNGSKLDLDKWTYELGVVRNHGSSQAYVKDCVAVKRGKLVITSKFKKTPNVKYDKAKDNGEWNLHMPSRPYASGSITTRGIVLFEPGCRLEIRAKLPKAKGAWPALWLLGAEGAWPANGEIDIMEHISQEPNTHQIAFHWGKEGTREHESKGYTVPLKAPFTEFHTYVMEWEKESITIYLDGDKAATFDTSVAKRSDGTNPYHLPAYLIINTAIGGPGTWPESPDAKDYPATFEVDYVRYYRKDDKKAIIKK